MVLDGEYRLFREFRFTPFSVFLPLVLMNR
jgi:hypothetical protein